MRKTGQMLLLLVMIAGLLVSCGTSSDTDMFEEAKRLEAGGQYEKALGQYDKLADTYETSPLRAEALCRAGLITFIRNDNREKAVSYFEKVSSEYPEEVIGQGCAALQEFLVSDSSSNPVEGIYHAGLAYTNLINDFDTGIEVLDRLVREYPDSKRAPEALFMSGFILANSAADTAEARQLYNRFLADYPSHALAVSVEWELEHLGQDINSIPEMRNIDSESVK